ncbi:MAG: divalent-cation tolerance protein CutA [Sideroxydans sp.]|nr:divalent-cation tolerance protein CutA [Sideroxydans sp.]NOT97899.1 divalent-cation tolerance protein CutA [Sideroxydans sp.]
MNSALLVITHVPDYASAESIAQQLIQAQLAACVNVQAECGSIYRWQGKLENVREVALHIKTTRAAYPALEATLRKLHPYDLPEIIALPITQGLPDYLNWVAAETRIYP